MNSIIKLCKLCQEPFEASLKELKRGNGFLCSRRCAGIWRAQNVVNPQNNCFCAFCNKPFYKNTSKQKNSKSGLFFCCREHKDKAQQIGGIKEIMPSHYGDGSSSYRDKAVREKGRKCERCGYDKYPICEVHHKDRNRQNNDLSNLEVLCSRCHDEDHYLAKDGKWTPGVGDA